MKPILPVADQTSALAGLRPGISRDRASYGHENYDRLVTLKNKYDPANLFRMNQNILPTA